MMGLYRPGHRYDDVFLQSQSVHSDANHRRGLLAVIAKESSGKNLGDTVQVYRTSPTRSSPESCSVRARRRRSSPTAAITIGCTSPYLMRACRGATGPGVARMVGILCALRFSRSLSVSRGLRLS